MKSRLFSAFTAGIAAVGAMLGFGKGAAQIAAQDPPRPNKDPVYVSNSRRGHNKFRLKFAEVMDRWLKGKWPEKPHRHYNLAERYRQRYTNLLSTTETERNEKQKRILNNHARRRIDERRRNRYHLTTANAVTQTLRGPDISLS